MRRHLRKPGVWIAALILLALWLLWPRPVSSPPPASLPSTAPTTASGAPMASPPPGPAAPAKATLPSFLPDEALATIRRIQGGGPFEHHQDGGIFGNREGHLPARPSGYYREYTVETPRLPHRGARRIVTGGQPPEVWYYTDDHYDSFRAFQVPAGTAAERTQ
jgi:guanyl-specific ribonuclease Sa